jgi:hypothetical protein
LTVCMAVFEYQNQAIFNMTVFFDGEPRCHIDTCFWYPNKNVVFGILKASHFQYDYFLRERVGVRLKLIVLDFPYWLNFSYKIFSQ